MPEITSSNLADSKNKKSFYIIGIIATTCFAVFWIYNLKIFSFIGLAFLLISLFMFDISSNLQMYFFMLPNISMLVMEKDGFAVSSLFIIFLFIKLLFKRNFKIEINFLFIIMLYFLSSIITYSLQQDQFNYLLADIRILLNSITLIAVTSMVENKDDYFFKISDMYINGMLFCGFYAIWYSIAKKQLHSGFRLENINSDPNYFSLCIAFAISVILIRIYTKSINESAILKLLALFILGFMTLSRGFLVAVSLNVIFLIYLFFFSNKITTAKKILITVVLAIFTVAFWNYIYNIFLSFQERFTDVEYSGGSGRIEIWSMYFNNSFVSIKNLFFGIGGTKLIWHRFGTQAVQHNLYLELFTGRGLIGCVIIPLFYYNIYKINRVLVGNKKIYFITVLPLLSLGLGFLFLSGLTSDISIITIYLGMYAMNVLSKNIKQNEKQERIKKQSVYIK